MHTMSFGDHLDELRRRLLLALVAPLPLFFILFLVSNQLIEWLLLPVYHVLRANDLPAELQVLSPPEFLLARLKLSIITALVLSAPWLLWQAWKFIAPGLYGHEQRFVRLLLPGSGLLTVAGLALMYFVMLPLMLNVLVMLAAEVRIGNGPALEEPVAALIASEPPIAVRTAPPAAPTAGEAWLLVPALELQVAIADPDADADPDSDGAVKVVSVPRGESGRIDQVFRVSFVIDFTLVLMLGIVIAFQMPLVIVLLGWLNLVSVGWLRAKRKYALGICGVVAAVITPADAFSMIIMLVPLYALYELGILLLMVAPASRVAEGTVFRFGRGSRGRRGGADKSPARADQIAEAAQPDGTVPRKRPAPGTSSEKTEEEGGS